MPLYIQNDHTVIIDKLQNGLTGDYINTATIVMTVVDESGDEVLGSSFPITVAYVAASNGKYMGSLPYTLSLANTAEYRLLIDVDAATIKAHYSIPMTAEYRQS